MMRSRFCLFLLLLLLPCAALAEVELTLSTECLAAESVLDFTVSGEVPGGYRYTLFQGDKQLFTHDTALAFGSYIPRESGDYTLQVAPVEDEAAAVQAAFTVTDKLACTLGELPRLKAGEPLLVRPQVTGGTGVYSYVYAITTPQGETSAWAAEGDWHYVPAEAGDYAVTVTVTDSIGASTTAQAAFTVGEGAGISLESCGGALRAHGGQQSWIVYAPGEWTATTSDDFITLSTSQGTSGQVLTVTVDTPTATTRRGSITIASAGKEVTHTVLQSASHGVDEEISLLPAAAPTQVDGSTHAAWLNADGSKTFVITSGAAWTVQTDADFLQIEHSADQLTLTVDFPIATARSGLVTVTDGVTSAYIHVYQPGAAVAEAAAQPVSLSPQEAKGFTLYSQSSGQWKDAPYGRSTLEVSGCAIFALSHALQYLGFEGEKITPEYLAANYSFALREGGTMNSTLVGNVGDDLGYKTRFELYESLPTIRKKLEEGAVFSFAVVNGHIAMVAEQSEDGSMFHIIDSAPSATMERIKNAQLYRREADGSFAPITSLTELEGIRYYIENGAFGGADYWLEASYVTKRGVRLIQPE